METNITPTPESAAPPKPALPPTPLWWRLVLGAGVIALTVTAWAVDPWIGARGRAAIGIVVFVALVATFSANLRAINWRTVGMGMLLQLLLALFILKLSIPGPIQIRLSSQFYIDCPEGQVYRPGYELFRNIGEAVKKFLEFSDKGGEFVFGDLTNQEKSGFIFAVKALPPIIFVSSFFTVLYYFGVLQFVVRILARAMVWLMGTSGAETLSAVANVFMGQTEAPLIVKPYVAKMTQSELLALMVGGMATISGGIMAVYIGMGADQVAILATSVMAAPCGLYLSKMLLPELEEPQTRGTVKVSDVQLHRNAIDAAAGGASDGLFLALNVAAMLIAFIAFIACIDYGLGLLNPDWSLKGLFSVIFWPVAMLLGVDGPDIPAVANLLGTKLAANEFVAYLQLTGKDSDIERGSRSFILSTYALTGFANFASVGIQLGGIGAMAPERRPDLARLGMRALFVGFTATLVNAALAGLLM